MPDWDISFCERLELSMDTTVLPTLVDTVESNRPVGEYT